METCGFDAEVWQAAKEEVKVLLVERLRAGLGPMTYGDLVRELLMVDLEAHDPRLNELLRQVSADEVAEGRGMLTAMVVLHDSQRPGSGFFVLARDLGRDVRDPDACWVAELNRLAEVWPAA
jgi:hypothetical protein